jgi:hypothetical protein
MGHHILGFIAKHDELRRAAAELPGARVAPLNLGFGFLPTTEELVGEDEEVPYAYLERLTARLGEWAADQSRGLPLAYVETDYFGGVGSQAAIAWVGGGVVFGPLRTPPGENGFAIGPASSNGASNQAVVHPGVARGKSNDEFDALGLGVYRSNEKWLAATGEAGTGTT